MSRKTIAFTSMGLGAALMYLLDPHWGRRRRALVRDQTVHLWHQAEEGWRKAARDLGNRAHGFVAEARSSVLPEPADDEVLVERVRERMGRVVSHPGAITVSVTQGRVRVSGPILAAEVDRLLMAVHDGSAGIKASR